MKSDLEKFYKKSIQERQELIAQQAHLTSSEMKVFNHFGALEQETADRLIENVISVMEIPLGVATNFIVNGKEVLVPMAVEESSVVAAASHGAKLARPYGGFFAYTSRSLMFAQIQLLDVNDLHGVKAKIYEQKEEILSMADEKSGDMKKYGGGATDLEVRVFDEKNDLKMLVIHLIVDTQDAMGANTVNTMAEHIAPYLEKLSGGKILLRIVSNLADKRIARARCTIKKEDLGGEIVVKNIVRAYEFAAQDPYRAATHNKGIMNGINPVALSTGNDTRAVEAGAHAYAARFGRYTSLSVWEEKENGDLSGVLELPMAVGVVGGVVTIHPKAKLNLKLMQVKKASDLAKIMVSVGLAQNLTALKALATEGIQKGHMRLHAKNIAAMAGAVGPQIEKIAEELVAQKDISLNKAKEILTALKF